MSGWKNDCIDDEKDETRLELQARCHVWALGPTLLVGWQNSIQARKLDVDSRRMSDQDTDALQIKPIKPGMTAFNGGQPQNLPICMELCDARRRRCSHS